MRYFEFARPSARKAATQTPIVKLKVRAEDWPALRHILSRQKAVGIIGIEENGFDRIASVEVLCRSVAAARILHEAWLAYGTSADLRQTASIDPAPSNIWRF